MLTLRPSPGLYGWLVCALEPAPQPESTRAASELNNSAAKRVRERAELGAGVRIMADRVSRSGSVADARHEIHQVTFQMDARGGVADNIDQDSIVAHQQQGDAG